MRRRNRRSQRKLSKLFPLAILLFLAILGSTAPAFAGFEILWQDSLQPAQSWHRPTANMQEAATGAPTPYSVQSIYVAKSGLYQIDSDQPDSELPFNGYVFLYAGAFDPNQPLLNLIAGNEAGPDGASLARIAGPLTAGAIYHVVTTSDDTQPHAYNGSVSGPGAIHVSGCAASGGVADSNTSLSLNGGRFCVSVTWTDSAGTVHTAYPVQFRSDSSAGFWFSDSNTWEVQVKVLDACKINHHFWTMVSGTTHLDYQVNIEDSSPQSTAPRRSYHSRVGSGRSMFDTQAFDGCPAGAAARRR